MTLLGLIIFSFSLNLTALDSPDKIELIINGQEAVFDCQWQRADSIFTELYRIDSTDPAGYLYRAAALQAEMTDKEEDLHGTRFMALCDSAKTAAKKRLENCTRRDSAFCYLYLGHQYAYRSLWESRFRSNFSALKLGMKAKSAYQKGLEVDSTLYDLYLGLGNYHYWKSVRSGLLRSFGIFKDEREKGIKEIELAADSSLFSRDAALSALLWIMIDRKDFDSAIALGGRMLEKYASGNTFSWPLGEALYNAGRYDGAYRNYRNIWYHLLHNNTGNYYNFIECAYWLYKSCGELGDKKMMKEIINEIRQHYEKIPRKTKRRQKQKLNYLLKQNG
ncbi:MAG: hypothetical protein DRP46_08915 [Candidatus Zixiibacteriota bacterium]|nr:MAG: hypothetical protein DRP46_08915 [candidate division Zixibacteria bacterium]